MCCDYGYVSFGGGVGGAVGPGRASWSYSEPCYQRSVSCIRTLMSASTPNTSEVGTVCVSSASTGLCGGAVTGIPTATGRRPRPAGHNGHTISQPSREADEGVG